MTLTSIFILLVGVYCNYHFGEAFLLGQILPELRVGYHIKNADLRASLSPLHSDAVKEEIKPVSSQAVISPLEWAGWECKFNAVSGQPIPIDDEFVPSSLKEWDIKVFGYEMLTSERIETVDEDANINLGSGKHILYRKTARVYPETGCALDNLAVEVQTTRLHLDDPTAPSIFTVAADKSGPYTRGFAIDSPLSYRCRSSYTPDNEPPEKAWFLETVMYGKQENDQGSVKHDGEGGGGGDGGGTGGQRRVRVCVCVDVEEGVVVTNTLPARPIEVTVERAFAPFNDGNLYDGGGLDGHTVAKRTKAVDCFVKQTAESVSDISDGDDGDAAKDVQAGNNGRDEILTEVYRSMTWQLVRPHQQSQQETMSPPRLDTSKTTAADDDDSSYHHHHADATSGDVQTVTMPGGVTVRYGDARVIWSSSSSTHDKGLPLHGLYRDTTLAEKTVLEDGWVVEVLWKDSKSHVDGWHANGNMKEQNSGVLRICSRVFDKRSYQLLAVGIA